MLGEGVMSVVCVWWGGDVSGVCVCVRVCVMSVVCVCVMSVVWG